MESGQTIVSALRKPEKRSTRTKKKRLTFEDEENTGKSEETLTFKDIKQAFMERSTNFLKFGFVFIKSISQQGLNIVGATYNSRSKRLVLADGKGFFSLDLLPSNQNVRREMNFPKYQFSMARIITYSEKFNVYFVLQKDFSIKVYNKDYVEVCSVENRGSGRLIFISFNPVKNELISGGFKGVKTWKFKEKRPAEEAAPVPMYNYGLFPSSVYPYMGKSWCTNMDFDVPMQRYYCFSEGHFYCYDINGKMLLQILNAHETAILCCAYSAEIGIFLTSSKGSEIKSWNGQGNLLHVFQGHSKTVTKLLLHPSIASLFISGSLDGSVKLWSLDSMEVFYSISLFQEGILWIGVMEDQFMYCCSARNLHIYDLNSFTSFWTSVNSPISNLYLCGADGKSSRVVAMGVDNSLRIFSLHNGTRLSTVLPPPSPLLHPVLGFAYNRASGTIYLLLTPRDIWVYTARTEPACRAAVWTIGELQQHLQRKHPLASCVQKNEYFQHTRKRNVKTPARCECLCSLSSPLCYLTDEGMVYADSQEFLVLGMQDGRVLFLHTSIQNLVYYEMAATKDPVIRLRHDTTHHQLIIIYQRLKHKMIHFRSLPALKLVFQIQVSDDTTVFTRLNSSLIIGLTSGIVDILNIRNEEKGITSSGKNINENGESVYSCFDNYHDGPVVAVDSCENRSIFLSCGSDTVIKLWDLQKNLLAEITLDNTLSTACFLNSSGDILLAFKSDLYILPLTKALGISKRNIETSTVLAAESFIFESPLLENIDVSKSIEMASYLEPYKGFAFTEDFTSDLQFLLKKKEKPAWRLLMAPSEIYCSPCTSEGSLKMFDFLIQGGPLNLEEQDKVEMSRKMIVTEDKKYVPAPKSVPPTEWELPFFGVSPCSSLIHEEPRKKAQPEEKISEAEIEVAALEPLPEILSEKQNQIGEETSSELLEITQESATILNKIEISEPISDTDYDFHKKEEQHPSTKREIESVKFATWSSHPEEKVTPLKVQEMKAFSKKPVPKEHMQKKLLKMEKLGLKKMQTPKRAKKFSAPKSAMRSRDVKYVPYTRSSQSVNSIGQKICPPLGTKDFLPYEKRPTSRKKTKQEEKEHYELSHEKDIIRAVTWRRRQNELICQAEERRILLELNKRLCSRNHCFTPTNSQQYQHLQPSESLPETLFSWMQPDKHSHPYTVMEETIIKLPRDFPYRLAWGTPATQDLGIKLYCPKMKLNKERKMSSLLIEKNLQPTKSIPEKGRYILVNDQVPASSTPPMSPLESKLLSVRFPKMKEKILCSLMSDL
ncbi:uncharacterized protein LOC100552577 isoform X2 [Anolis carolinensis]|uniref:uncharacterized protein LOC100552577 isoform X2 n=1 Tax=Anolis carolinensis TaxID=28377 RepID=UPI002F2B7980